MFLRSETLFFKSISILLSLSLLSFPTDSARASNANPQKAATDISLIPQISYRIDIKNIVIPQSMGLTKHSYHGRQDKLIIHIQDLHANFDAQKKISEMIKSLVSQYWVNLVCVEGAQGMIDVGAYREIPDKILNERVARYLLKGGILTGAEYLAITTDEAFKFFGAENIGLHRENLEEFREAILAGSEVREVLEALGEIIGELKKEHYSDELLEFDKLLTDYHERGINTKAYFEGLNQYAKKLKVDLSGKENLTALLQAQRIEENIDFHKVDEERNQVLQKLSQSLGKEELQKLVRKSLLLRLGKVTAREYYAYIEEVIKQEGQEKLLGSTPHFKRYLSYMKFLPKGSPEAVFEEAEVIESQIKERVLRKVEEKRIDRVARNIYIFKNFLSLTLTSQDLAFYDEHRSEIQPEALLEDLKSLGGDGRLSRIDFSRGSRLLSKWNEGMEKAQSFYETAKRRDTVLVENLLRQMEEEQTSSAILVTGGFHTEGMMKQLKERGISYMVLMPNITTIPEESKYLEIMMGKGLPLKGLIDTLYRMGIEGSKIYQELFISKPMNYGWYLAIRAAMTPEDMTVLEFPKFKLVKTHEAVEGTVLGRARFWVESNESEERFELGSVVLNDKAEVLEEVGMAWGDLKTEEKLTAFLEKIIQEKQRMPVSNPPASNIGQLLRALDGVLEIGSKGMRVIDQSKYREVIFPYLSQEAQTSENPDVKAAAEQLILEEAAFGNKAEVLKPRPTALRSAIEANELYEEAYQPEATIVRTMKFARMVLALLFVGGVVAALDVMGGWIFKAAGLFSMPMNLLSYSGFGLIMVLRGLLFVELAGYIIHRFFQHVGFLTRHSQFAREGQKPHRAHHDRYYPYGPAYQHRGDKYKQTEEGAIGRSWLVLSLAALVITVAATILLTILFNLSLFAAILGIVIYLAAAVFYAIFAVDRIHAKFHQKGHRWEKHWYYRWISALHILHHKYQKKIFSIVFPLMDLLVGSYISSKSYEQELKDLFDDQEITVSDLFNWRYFLTEALPPDYADYIADIKKHTKSYRKLEGILEVLRHRIDGFPEDEDAKIFYQRIIDFLKVLNTPKSLELLNRFEPPRVALKNVKKPPSSATRHAIGQAIPEELARVDVSRAVRVQAENLKPILELLRSLQIHAPPEFEINRLISDLEAGETLINGKPYTIQIHHQNESYLSDLPAFSRVEGSTIRIYLSSDLSIPEEDVLTDDQITALVGLFHEAREEISLRRLYPQFDSSILHRMAIYDEARLMQSLQDRVRVELRHEVLSPLTVKELRSMDVIPLDNLVEKTVSVQRRLRDNFKDLKNYEALSEKYTQAVGQYARARRDELIVERIHHIEKTGSLGAAELAGVGGHEDTVFRPPKRGPKVLYGVDRGVATMTLNRPNKLNVLDLQTVLEIKAHLEEAKEDPNVKMVLFKGSGQKAFCAGGDMTAVLELVQAGRKEDALSFFREENAMDRLIHEFPKPVISFADGITMGGGLGISRNSQILVATDRSRFAMPETKIGFFPDVGSTHFLPQSMGKAVAKYFAMTGQEFDGKEALWSGLVDGFVESSQILDLEEKIKNELGSKEMVSIDDVKNVLSTYPQPEPTGEFKNRMSSIEKLFGKEDLQEILADLANATGFGGGDIEETIRHFQDLSEQDLVKKLGPSGDVFVAQEVLWILARRSPMSLKTANDLINLYPGRTRTQTLEEDLSMVNRVLDEPDFIQGVTDVLIQKKRDPGHRPNWQGNIFELSNTDQEKSLQGESVSEIFSGPSVFRALSRADRESVLKDYLAYLRERDGVPDRPNRKFSIREKFFRDLEQNPVRFPGPPIVDQAMFSRNEERNDPEPDLNETALWALAMAKSNRAEHYGVMYGLDRIDASTRGLDNPLSYIEVEEFYHTRVLRDALEVLGLEMRLLKPHFATAFLIRRMADWPKPISNVLIFCAEVVGIAAFRLLRDKARELFKDQPEEARARIEALFQQIIVDEIGHAHYVHSQLGPVRLWIARRILPLFTRYFLKEVPELERLFGRDKLMRTILDADIDGAALDYPERFVPSRLKGTAAIPSASETETVQLLSESRQEEAGGIEDPYLISKPEDWDKLAATFRADPDKFWLKRAYDELEWFKKPTKGITETVDAEGHFSFTYFEDGELNASYEILDRQVKRGMGDMPAYTWIGDPADDQGNAEEVRIVTYRELLAMVEKFANALTEMGVKKGDGITLYTASNTIEAKVARFAAMRIGAVFTPVFPGLSAQELSDRAHQINTKVVLTVNGGFRKGEVSRYKEEVVDKAFEEYISLEVAQGFLKNAIAKAGLTGDAAQVAYDKTTKEIKGYITIHFSELAKTLDKILEDGQVTSKKRSAAKDSIQAQTEGMPSRINNIVVIERVGRERAKVPMKEGRDVYFGDVIKKMETEGKTKFEPVHLPSEHPLFVIFTSGTTGKPKGAYHTTGGYLTNISYSMKFAWGVKPGERIFVAADDGWITGNSAMSDAPLLNGMHSFLYEGLPNWPTSDRLWKILSENKINYYKTGVTSVRDFSKGDAKLITKWDLSSMKASCSCAEPLYPYVQAFWEEVILGGRKEGFANFFWRTEDGMFSPFIPHPLGKAQKPDASTVPSPWAQLKILVLEKDEDGKITGFREARPGEVGSAFIRHHPAMIRGLWNDLDRFRDTYWPQAVVIDGKRWHKVGDAAKVDEQGYVTFLGRDDEVINTSGHRIGTQEIESQVGKVDEVRLASVVGMPHLTKGETPIAFVILKPDVKIAPELDTKIRKAVEEGKGKIARPEEIIYVNDLPQTLSKKILRRFLEIIAAMPRDELSKVYQKLQDEDIRTKVINKDETTLTALFGEKVGRSAQTLPVGVGGTAGLIAAVFGIAEKREISKTAERETVHTGDPYDVDFAMYLPKEAKDFVSGQFRDKGYGPEDMVRAKRHYEMVRRLSREAARQGLDAEAHLKEKLNELGYDEAQIAAAKKDVETVSAIRAGAIQTLIDQGLLWPLGKPYLPGERLPKYMFAWAIVKDKSGRPVYGQPEVALYEIIAPTPKPGPNELIGYTLYAGITRNIVAAGEDANVGGFNFHDRDYHISGSDGVFVTAKIGSEVERAGITKAGEIFNNYSGEADLLDYRMGYDPMATIGFKIKGYQTPDGTMAQFSRFQGPQLMRKPEVLSFEEASSYNLDLGTVYKAIVDRAGVSRGDRVYIEGAAGGTGHLAVEVAAMQGAVVTGLVSSQDRGEFAKEHGATSYIIRKDPRFKTLWQPVPDPVREPEKYREWVSAAESFKTEYQKLNDGHLADMINASVGRPTFAANVELLASGGKLVYYGADKGFSLTFRGKPGSRTAEEAFKKNRLQPGEGVLVYYGAGADAQGIDEAAIDAISAAITRKGRVVVLTNTVEQQIYLQKRFGRQLAGIESIESLKAKPNFDWPEEMPDLDVTDPSGKISTDAAKRYHYQEHTLKIIGSAVGRFLRTQDNPTGFPDIVVERSGQNTLGISAWMARPITGRVLYLEDSTDKKFRFYAPDIWMHQKTIDFPTFSILGTHLFNSFQANVVGRKLDTGQLKMAIPKTFDWTNAPTAVQELYDGEVKGTNTVRVGAPAVSGAKTEADLYKNWKVTIKTFGTVKVKNFELATGQTIAQVVMEGPNLNALNTAMVDSLGQAVDWIAQNASVKSMVLTGGGFKSYVAGADIKELQLIIDREEGRELAKKAQSVYARIEALNVPVVSAINGFALGGGTELAMSTHYRVASAKSEMGQPEINLGLIPGFGGTQRLPRLLSRKMGERGLIEATKIILNGRRIPAEKAQKLGLVDELAESDSLARAMELTVEYIKTGKGVLADAMSARHQEIKDWDKAVTIEDGVLERDPEIKTIIDQSREMGRTNAVTKALGAIYAGLRQGISKGLDLEAEAFGDLIVGPNDGRKFIEDFLKKQSPPLPAHGAIEESQEPTIIEVSRLVEEASTRLGYRAEDAIALPSKKAQVPGAIKPLKLDPALESYRSQVVEALETLLKKYGSTLVIKDRPSFDEGFTWDKETREWVYEISLTTWELIAERMRDGKKTPEGRPFLAEYLEHVDYWAKDADIAEHLDVLAMFWEAAERDRERGLPAASREAIAKAVGTKFPGPAVPAEPEALTTEEGKTIPLGPIDPSQWKDKVVIVTGGGTGLGKETVLNYAKAGAHVIINGRRMDKLEETAKEIKAATGMDITLVQGDVVGEKDLETLFQTAKDKFGHVDIVINNAGVSGDVKLLPMIPVKKFIYDAMIHLHIWNTTRLLTNLMKEQNRPGTIINVATYFTTPSRYEKRPYLFRTPYTLAQAMKIALTRLFAREVKGSGIVIAALNPGPFEGERISTIVYPKGSRIRDIIGTQQDPEAIRKGTEGLHAERFVEIKEVSKNIMLMTADEHRSSFNGEVIPMGGIDYPVPPAVLPVIELGTQPDLAGRTVVLTASREAHPKLASAAKALASSGAKVWIGTEGGESLKSEFTAYGGRITIQEVDLSQEGPLANFFGQLESAAAVFHITGEPDTSKNYSRLNPEELMAMIHQFTFVPTVLIGKYASAAMIYQGMKKAGIEDGRVRDFGNFLEFMERELDKEPFEEDELSKLDGLIDRLADSEVKERLLELVHRYTGTALHEAWSDEERQFAFDEIGKMSRHENLTPTEVSRLGRLSQGIGRLWTSEEKKIFQIGLTKAKGQIAIVGPEYESSKDPLSKYRSEVFREGIEAAFTSFAAELAAAKSGIRVNVILPGSLGKGAGDSQKLNRMMIYMASQRASSLNGLVLEPDERNSAAGWLPSLEGKKVIVTGGARNMGKSIAQKMAAAGAHVLIAARTQDALKATAGAIEATGGNASSVVADVSSPEQIKTLTDQALKDLKGVDVLINNAGVAGVFARTDEIPTEDVNPAAQQFGWNTTMKINFHGPLELMARVIPIMRRSGGGTIEQIVTEYHKLPYIFRSIYVGSKAALGALSLAVADQLSKENIFISNINPSLIAGERMDLVLRNNIARLRKEGTLTDEHVELMNRQIDEWRLDHEKVRKIVETLEAKSATDIPRDVLKPIAWFWSMISLSTEQIESKEPEWGRPLTDIVQYFKLILPLNPPTNDDVGIETVHVAAKPQMTAKKDRYVSDLAKEGEPPIHRIPDIGVNVQGIFEGKTALLAAADLETKTLEELEALIESYLSAGAGKVVVALGRFPEKLKQRMSQYPDKVEFILLDFEKENRITGLFEKQNIDAAVYLISNPSLQENFSDFYFDPRVSTLRPEEFEEELKDHRERRERFERLHLTGPTFLFREAAKRMRDRSQLIFITPHKPGIEGITTTKMLAELVQVRNHEKKILGKGISASVWDSQDVSAVQASRFVVALTAGTREDEEGETARVSSKLPAQLLITRAAREKFGLQGALYTLMEGPGEDDRQIQYSSPVIEQWMRQLGFYRHEIVWLGVLHEVRHEAIREMRKVLEGEHGVDFLEELGERLKEALEGEENLKNFLRAFYLTFPEPELYGEMLETGIKKDEIDQLIKSYLWREAFPEGEVVKKVQEALDRLLIREGGLDLGIEELLVRYLESQNEQLREHPLLKSDFYEGRSFRIMGETLEGYFKELAQANKILTEGRFKGQPTGLSLLKFSNGSDFKTASILEQLRNASRNGFNLRGVDPNEVKITKYYGHPLLRFNDGKTLGEAGAITLNKNTELLRPDQNKETLSRTLQHSLEIIAQALQKGDSTLTVASDHLNVITQTQGSQTVEIMDDFLRALFIELGFKEIHIKENLRDEEIVNLFNWLALALTVARRDGFTNLESAKKIRDQFNRSSKRAKEIKVKTFTLAQIQNDFIDQRTHDLMDLEMGSGVRYVVLTDKGENIEKVKKELVARYAFSPSWFDKGQVQVIAAIERKSLEGKTAKTLDVDRTIHEIKEAFGLPDDGIYLSDPSDQGHETNFVLAVEQGLELTGRHHDIRYIRVQKGVRLSQTLTFLQGLFTAPLSVVVDKMRDYLLENGFSEEDLEDLKAMKDEALLPPPVTTGNLLRQLKEEKKIADMISWAA